MIEVRNLQFTYSGTTVPAIKQISFTIEPGEIFGLLGPSGAGKSTTQKILIGLLKEYQGEVCVMGRDLKAWHADYYEQVGVSFAKSLSETHRARKSAIFQIALFRFNRLATTSAGHGRSG
jgi:fluoroquinolone transport system ATP-binding protein